MLVTSCICLKKTPRGTHLPHILPSPKFSWKLSHSLAEHAQCRATGASHQDGISPLQALWSQAMFNSFWESVPLVPHFVKSCVCVWQAIVAELGGSNYTCKWGLGNLTRWKYFHAGQEAEATPGFIALCIIKLQEENKKVNQCQQSHTYGSSKFSSLWRNIKR